MQVRAHVYCKYVKWYLGWVVSRYVLGVSNSITLLIVGGGLDCFVVSIILVSEL